MYQIDMQKPDRVRSKFDWGMCLGTLSWVSFLVIFWGIAAWIALSL